MEELPINLFCLMKWEVGFLVFQSLAVFAAAQCSSEPCKNLVSQEFQPDSVVCAASATINGYATYGNRSKCSHAACTWQVLDLIWCAEQSSNDNTNSKRYSIYTSGVSGAGTAYTNDCRAFIESGGVCRLKDVSAAIHSISAQDLGLAASAVTLEMYHFVTIVVLKFKEVSQQLIFCTSIEIPIVNICRLEIDSSPLEHNEKHHTIA